MMTLSRDNPLQHTLSCVLFPALFALGCSSAEPHPATFGGQGAAVDPGPAAGKVEATSASADPCATPSPTSQDSRVEDFEDGDNRLFGGFEREGYWYSATDHTPDSRIFPADGAFKASELPAVEATVDNRMAGHFSAQGQKDWGAVWGTTLRHVADSAKCSLNAGHFAGLRFRARGKGSVRVRFGMPETVASEYGGRCSERCWDVHELALHLTEDWQSREVRWDQLQQEGWGKSVHFDPKRLLGIEFAAKPDNLPADFWIDDLVWISEAKAP
ncbi:MAG TPA: carbohydrate binding domain-containing protein [Polyangiaceae bacterium]|nr:carbohydrate binding domain-containing protein [Polyangiaceae bacterium]